jgi:hypothetical protein
MKAKEFDKLVNDTVDACKEQMGLTPEDVWMIYFRKHLDAITTAVKDIRMGKTRVVSEPLDGRFDDAINYLMLGKALFIDRRKK